MSATSFSLSVPADDRFRPLAAATAAKYAECLGLPEDEASAVESAVRQEADRLAAAGASDLSIAVATANGSLEVTISADGQSATVSRRLPQTR